MYREIHVKELYDERVDQGDGFRDPLYMTRFRQRKTFLQCNHYTIEALKNFFS